jgi:hypothetical protein
MKKTILMLALAAISTGAMAEWVELEPGFFADSNSIRHVGDNVRITFVKDLLREKLVQGRPYLSVTSRREFDCSLKRQRALLVEFYSGQMAQGSVVADDPRGSPWVSAREGEDIDMWNLACSKAKLK